MPLRNHRQPGKTITVVNCVFASHRGALSPRPSIRRTHQTITQRALTAPSIRKVQKGVYAAAVIRLIIIPPVIAIPGICAFKLYGKLGDVFMTNV